MSVAKLADNGQLTRQPQEHARGSSFQGQNVYWTYALAQIVGLQVIALVLAGLLQAAP